MVPITKYKDKPSNWLLNKPAAKDIPLYPSLSVAQPYASVSAVIITYNEEHILPKALSKLWWCDEIIIIDSGSSDQTLSICEQYNCNVFIRPFNGFGEQKKYGVSKAKNNWILCIDADEIVSDELIEEIRKELCKPLQDYAGYAMPRKLVFMNHPFKYGKEASPYIIRLFNKQRGNWDNAVVHEKLKLDGAVKQLKNKIYHYSYTSYGQFLQKINLYSSLGARKLELAQVNRSKWKVAIAIPFNFFKYYILNRNFLNGFHGFAWAVLNTFYHFVKYVKVQETQKKM